MAIDPRISLALNVPQTQSAQTVSNIFQSNLNNAQNRRANEQNIQQQAALQPLQLQQAQQSVDANTQAAAFEAENANIRSLVEAGVPLKSFLESGDNEGAVQFLQNRQAEITARGGDTSQTDGALNQILSGNPQNVLQGIQANETIAQQRGLLGGNRSTGTASQRDFQTFQDLNLKAQQTGDPADILAAQQFGVQSGFGRPSAAQVQEQAISKAQQLANIAVETSEKIETKKSQLGAAAAAKKLAVTKSGVAFDKLANIDVAMGNFDDAIRAIDEGAQTGAIISSLPSFKKSSIELDNIQKALGLDVVSNTTFGALSESELKFALDKALPKNLQPQDLKVWLQAKKAAQLKLRDHISDAAQFLGTGENTIPDWIELQKAKAVIQQQPEQIQEVAPVAQQTSTQPALQPSAGNADVPETGRGEGTIMVDANGNRARVFADGTFEEL